MNKREEKEKIKELRRILKECKHSSFREVSSKVSLFIEFEEKSKKTNKYLNKIIGLGVKSGDASAMYYKGIMSAWSSTNSLDESIYWYTKAYEHGCDVALINLGKLYLFQLKDYALSLEYFDKAIQTINDASLLDVVDIFEDTKSPLYDMDKALKVYGKAALNGNKKAISWLIVYYYKRVFNDNGYSDTTDEVKYYVDLNVKNTDINKELEISNEEDKNNLFYWTKVGCEKEYKPAYAQLGYLYLVGVGCSKDEKKAFEYYKLAKDKQTGFGYAILGDLYFYGIGTKKNHEEALKCYEFVSTNNSRALEKLGDIYCADEGVKVDYIKAFNYYYRAANLDNASAQYKVGEFYKNGKGCEMDYALAKEYYEKASINGYEKAKKVLDNFDKEMLA